MRAILGDRYELFKSAYFGKPRHKALRVNTAKISVADFVALAERYESSGIRTYALRQNALCAESFYTDVKPSLDPLYHAGLYYMQEPSASAAVAAFSPYIGKRVLDLCAAPGGKSTQAAAFMNGGTIFCNEIDRSRAAALCENIERLGMKNAVVTCCDAQAYRRAGFDGYFDTLIVDAPCSGGGMTRYEDVKYSESIVAGCAARQRVILDDATELLCRGGYMLYSTCTFAPEENEDNIKYIMSKGFETVDIPLLSGEERGIGIADARRIYPHNFDGEGHFFCVLRKMTGEVNAMPAERAKPLKVQAGGAVIDAVSIRDVVSLPIEIPSSGMRMLRQGAEVFAAKPKSRDGRGGKSDSELSHALSHALSKRQLAEVGTVELSAADAAKYLRGEQLYISAERGNLVAAIDGYALGWVKCAPDGTGDSVLKNLYPKNLRIKSMPSPQAGEVGGVNAPAYEEYDRDEKTG